MDAPAEQPAAPPETPVTAATSAPDGSPARALPSTPDSADGARRPAAGDDELHLDEPEEAPPVVVVMVAHEPGPWFADALASVGSQTYPACSLLVVDVATVERDVLGEVAAVVPGAHVLRVEENRGFADAANQGADAVEGAAFYLFCHDDVRFDPDAVQLLVEESFRSNAAVVGPKVVTWDAPDRLLAVGLGMDKVAEPAPLVEHGELDQEQHDAVDDVFAVPSTACLVRTDLFEAIGGFDPAIDLIGEDLELCWRAHLAGARVLVAPAARVAHREALLERREVDDRFRKHVAHQTRAVATCYGRWHRMRVRPQLALLHLAELLVALVTARFGHARDLLGGRRDARRANDDWSARRDLVARIRKVPDRDIRHLQHRGFARLRGELRGRRGEDRDELAASVDVEAVQSARGGSAVTAWVLVVAFLVVGSRTLLTSGIPFVGEFAAFPGSGRELFDTWLSRYREVGVGTVGPAPSALGAFAGASLLTLGSTSVLRQVLILATLPLGAIGMWRLCRPIGSRRARVVGLFAYVAAPVAANAMARGRWGALVIYALAPWFLAVLARASKAAPFGDLGGRRGPGVPDRPVLHHVLLLGVIVALAAMVAPVAGIVVAVTGLALALGGALGGRAAGWYRLPLVALGSVVVAGILLAPWASGFLHDTWGQLVGVSTISGAGAPGEHLDLAHLLRFDSGPTGVGLAGYGLVVAALLPLLIGRDWRLVWATRCWVLALAAWASMWLAAQGWLSPFPAPEVPLAIAAVALAFAAALGMAAFEVDLPDYHFGWRQVVAVLAGAGFFVFLLPALGAAVDGSWRLPETDFSRTVGQLDERTDGPFRVLWVGDPSVLPLNGWAVPGTTEADGAPLAFGVSANGEPSVQDIYPVGGDGTALLAQALDDAIAGRTSRLGELLGPMGIRYVVVPDRRAPAPAVDVAEAPVPDVLAALDDQLDLSRIEGTLAVYQNAAWSPVRALLPEGSDGATVPPDLPTALRYRDGYDQFAGTIEDPSAVYLAADADDGWVLDVAGTTSPWQEAQGWSMVFAPATTGEATLGFTTPSTYRLLLAGQALVWGVVLIVLLRTRVARDERRRGGRA